MDTNQKGDVAELKTVLRAREKGLIVSKPMCDSARYDLLFDDGKTIKKVQVKWAAQKSKVSSGNARVELRRHNRTGSGRRVYEEGEVDLLVVYLPDVDKLCLFPPEVFVGRKTVTVRFVPAKNNQVNGCLMAMDYEW